MEGLEIIECIAIEQVPDWVLVYYVLGSLLVILVPTLIVWESTKNGGKALLTTLICGIIALMVSWWMMFSGVLTQPTGEYKYKVRLTEDVSYVEFTEQYEVITENDDGTYMIMKK